MVDARDLFLSPMNRIDGDRVWGEVRICWNVATIDNFSE